MPNPQILSKYIGRPDWYAVLIYLALVMIGWVSIYSAVYDESHSNIFDLSRRYGMQVIWIGMSFFLAIFLLLSDSKYYHILAYPLFVASVVILLGVALFGTEVKGARAWIMIGGVGIQPAELVKVTTSLALARFMSSYSFNIKNGKHLLRIAMIVGVPVFIIASLQNDVGSATVYTSFLFMLYREGLNRWVYVVLFMVVSLFVFSFLLEPVVLLGLIVLACAIAQGLVNRNWRSVVVYLSGVALGTLIIYMAARISSLELSLYASLFIALGVSMVAIFIYAYKNNIRNIVTFVALFVASVAFVYTVDFGFNRFQSHQQERILNVLGLEYEESGSSYNVNQSKIAIGSGGLMGKGFLRGTQTKFNFVPEQSTDFIICTVGEEWGFAGSALVVVLFMLLFLRLISMGERQAEPFGRIYCYSVASILLFHLLVNVGSATGIVPVIGIPLPFLSYGGSSMLAFTLLLFIAIKLDASRGESNF